MASAVAHSITAPTCFAPKQSVAARSAVARRCRVSCIAEPPSVKASTPTPTIEESEAAVVAGNAPWAPPPAAKPQAPAGTPSVSTLVWTNLMNSEAFCVILSSLVVNSLDFFLYGILVDGMHLPSRPRRNRKSLALRNAFQETVITPANFILPLFVHEGEKNSPIGAMPGCQRLGWRHGLIEEVYKARDVGVNSVVLFPKVPDALKSATADECYNEDGLVHRSIRLLKDKFPDLVIYTDVALDPYNSDGHDGICREDGVIMNDETVHQLCKQAVSQARAGADVVSPSDMMDGRIGAIRTALDAEGFTDVSIMAYTAKYASAFYGPFREALDSNPRFGDKKTYQMNPGNYREALIETRADEREGADILMVKPAMPYLDVIRLLRDSSPLPISAYQVSGEYSMIKAASAAGMLDERKAILESLLCIKRAGADVILTYFALQAARYLCGEE
ncbi:hypothetical protein AXG93_2960s1030 [Marchantia polymorpha subsp. ruderalis]|uniref:Delta-aminolevulinic acid dehydratase n=1 Tax=Marchantia polymorpha subsp. ruderalis TaxID=1480154 RepID=A0A176W9Z2_MARPO|nr:hypothetical protein AXG93_2960s1030 [Marchantia polymorpha subsp. ruderalis]